MSPQEPDRKTALIGVTAVLFGVVALFCTTVTTVLRIATRGESLERTGWDLHGPALPLLAILAAGLLPIALRGSAVAAIGILCAGLATIGITAIGDLPQIGSNGAVGPLLLAGVVRAGPGAYLEALGAILLMFGGGLLAINRRRP